MSYVNDQTVAGSAVGRLFVTRHFDQSAKSTVGTMHMQIGGGVGWGVGVIIMVPFERNLSHFAHCEIQLNLSHFAYCEIQLNLSHFACFEFVLNLSYFP